MYRGEQFDSDMGLYYLRANTTTPPPDGSVRDPEDGISNIPSYISTYMWVAIR